MYDPPLPPPPPLAKITNNFNGTYEVCTVYCYEQYKDQTWNFWGFPDFWKPPWTMPLHLPAPSWYQPADSLLHFGNTEESEVESLLLNVDPRKATGSAGIPRLVMINAANILAPSLREIFQRSLHQVHVPNNYSTSHISPLYKGGDKTHAINYRPVSLLPIVSRLLETIVKQRLVGYPTEKTLLPPTQFAYRRFHSTEDALVLAVDTWLAAKADHKTTDIVLVDMPKVVDRVQHSRLIQGLFSLGVGGCCVSWMCS